MALRRGVAAQEAEEATHARERAAEAALAREEEGLETPAEVDPHEDRTREMRTPGFSRMRTNWHSQDSAVVASVTETADDLLFVNFADAFQIINDIYDIVREPVRERGKVKTDRHGFPVWATTPSGRYIEDYTLLGIKERDEFLMQISTRLFDWEQRAADAWGESMFAKAQWEERFATTFLETVEGVGRKTDEARTQHARSESRDERYFALFKSLYSKKCDALIRSLERIGQRLKDTL